MVKLLVYEGRGGFCHEVPLKNEFCLGKLDVAGHKHRAVFTLNLSLVFLGNFSL